MCSWVDEGETGAEVQTIDNYEGIPYMYTTTTTTTEYEHIEANIIIFLCAQHCEFIDANKKSPEGNFCYLKHAHSYIDTMWNVYILLDKGFRFGSSAFI